MKALIISEDQKVYDTLNRTLQNAGYDTIIYKWLLKALDNIEEIRPDCIVVSSSEYPRHWKTLVQFVKSGIGGDDVQVYLYEPNPMSSEDEGKARILGITDYFTSLESTDLEKIFGKKENVQEETEPAAETVPADETVPTVENVPTVDSVIPSDEKAQEKTDTGHFMFTHPVTHKFVAGKYFDYNGKTMSCTFQDFNDSKSLSSDMRIEYFTFFDSKSTKNASVIVHDIVSISKDNTFVIVEPVQIYEEN